MQKLLTATIPVTLFLLAHSFAHAGWGDALLKQVVKDVATETVKQETTKAIVNQFNKADPNYQGPKTAAQAEAESAALSQSTASLSAEPISSKDLDGTKHIKRIKKKTDKVIVGGFRVAFILSNVATASEDNGLLNLGNSAGSATGITTVHQDRTVKKEKLLNNIDESVMQAIADAAYADFMAKLQASGVQVLPSSTLINSPHFANVDITPNPYKKDSGWFRPNDIHVYSPTALPLWFGHFDSGFGNVGALALGPWKSMNKVANENDAMIIIPQFVINFASMESSGRRSMFKKASVTTSNVIHLTSGTTRMMGFQSDKPSAGGDLGTVSLDDNYYVSGDFAVDYLVDDTDNAAWVNSMTRLTGTAGNIHSTETWAVVANPQRFKTIAIAATDAASDAFIELLKP